MACDDICGFYRMKAEKVNEDKFRCNMCNTIWRKEKDEVWRIIQNGSEPKEKVKELDIIGHT